VISGKKERLDFACTKSYEIAIQERKKYWETKYQGSSSGDF